MLEFIGGVQGYLVWDAMWAAGIMAGMVLFSFTLARHAMVPLLMGMALAAVVAGFVPMSWSLPWLSNFADYEQRVLVFLVLTLVGFVVCRKNKFFEPYVVPSAWELGIYGLVYGGFMIAVMGAMLPPDVRETLSPYIRASFVDDLSQVLWLCSPFVLLAVLRGSNADY